MNVKCFLLENTGKYTEPNANGVSRSIWKRVDTGEEFSGKFPVGAMWFYDEDGYPKGEDGRTLFVETPAGSWLVDGRASNCNMLKDNVHRCWCRHGHAPNITVDKNGNTCAAGAGSIAMGSYHGFLINGELTNC